MNFRFLLILCLLILCNGQLVSNPLLQSVTTYTGEALSSVLRLVSNGPIALAKSLGITASPSTFVNDNFLNSEQFITDFKLGARHEDVHLSIMELANKYGYDIEAHTVITPDGYILTVHRIPNKGPVVFLMHGLLGSSDDWVVAGPESGIAYLLSRAGYDVWLGNARGNKHSRRHQNLQTAHAEFWDFSWHEIGYYDLPTMIDHVLNQTASATLKYVGHSQGTTAFFVMGSERPEYNDKVSLLIALSPVAWMSHVASPLIRLMAPTTGVIHAVTRAVGLHEFLPDVGIMKLLRTLICGTGSLADVVCSNMLFLIVGFDFEQLNATNLPVLFSHVPSGAAAKQFVHYGQGIVSGDFKQFDYGRLGNVQRYGSVDPPHYQVERITTPVSLFYSVSDWLAHPVDVDILYNKLPNAIDIHKVPFDKFNHVDYMWAKDVKKLIFNRMEKLLRLF